MGSRMPDDTKGKSPASSTPPPILESNDPTNPIGTTAESPTSSTPPPILESNDPINPIGTTAESPASSTPRDNDDQTADEEPPEELMFPEMFHEVLYVLRSLDNKFVFARYQLVLLSSGYTSPQSINNFHIPISNLQGQQSSSAEVLPSFGHSYFPQGIGLQIAPTGNYQQVEHVQKQHPMSALIRPSQGSVGYILQENITGQGLFPTETPEFSNILGRRKREKSPPVGPSKKIAMPCRQGLNVNLNRSPPPSPTPSSPPSPPVVLQDSSQPLQPTGHKCTLCKRDVTVTPRDGSLSQPSPPRDLMFIPCGHVFHDECLKKIIPKDHAKKPLCILCATGET